MEKHIVTYKEIEEFNKNKVISEDLKLIFNDFKKNLGGDFPNDNFEIVDSERYKYLSSKRCKVFRIFSNDRNNDILADWKFTIVAVKDENEKNNFYKSLRKIDEYRR